MKTSNPPIWIFFTLTLLGFWLITAPGTFAFKSHALVVSDLLVGILLIVLSLYGRRRPTPLLMWTFTALGIWLNAAPLLFWAPTSGAYINNTLVGTFVIALSVLFFPVPGQIPDEEPTIPPGWSYNPSSFAQRIPIAFFAFLCWMISRYLAAYQLGYIDTIWDPFFYPGTQGVLESDVSKLFPVSDAGLGAFAYTLEFLSTLQGGKARWRTSPWGVLIFGILVIPVSLVSILLIILQPLAVGTWCTLCLVTAVCMLVPIPLALDEVIATLQYLKHHKEKSKCRLLFEGGVCPKASFDSRTPPLDQSFLKVLKASLWGTTYPWNLIISALLGVCLMAYPSYFHIGGILYDLDPILGASIAAISVISFAELARGARYLNAIIAIVLFIVSFFGSSYLLLHIFTAIVIALLCLRKGPIHEKARYANSSM